MKKLLLLLCFMCSYAFVQAQDMRQMKTFYLVLLNEGPNRNQSEQEQQTIQESHLKHLMGLQAAGKIRIVGPLLTDTATLKGICIYDASSEREVIELANLDPAVVSGRLTVQIFPFMADKESCLSTYK